jgi:hypothetical protein
MENVIRAGFPGDKITPKTTLIIPVEMSGEMRTVPIHPVSKVVANVIKIMYFFS